jgi:GT2 family glycosyltransferase
VAQTTGTPLVSVIVPTFNRSALVCRAVDSALQQTYSNIQVVVIDDGSTDDTSAVMNRRYGSDSRVKYVCIENGGVAHARNVGIPHCTGEFVGFLDSDDYWLPWKIELQMKCLERLPQAGMIWTDMDAVNDKGELVQRRYLRTMYSAYEELAKEGIPLFADSQTLTTQQLGVPGLTATFELSQGDIFSQMIIGSVVHTSTCLLRRERLSKVGGFREDLKISGEDYDFHLRTCREGLVAFADIATIGYTVGSPDQLTAAPCGIHIAQNALRTIEPILAQNRHQIRLSSGVIDRVLASRHAWIGEALLELGRRSEARGHFLKSIFHNPWAPRPHALLAACLMPAGCLAFLRARLRGGRRMLRRLRDGSAAA